MFDLVYRMITMADAGHSLVPLSEEEQMALKTIEGLDPIQCAKLLPGNWIVSSK